tara:strand:+ start:18 stop:1115 length:1098 start_codon:yes stop_codon:yes gene_type:complete
MKLNESFLFTVYKFSLKNNFFLKIFRKILKSNINLYLYITDWITFKSSRIQKDKLPNKKLNIHTQVWGDYVDWFLKYNLPSLLQKGNIPKLFSDGYEINLYIYTSSKDSLRLINDDLSKKLLNRFSNYGKYHINTFYLSDFNERNSIQMKNLDNFIKLCLKENAYFLHSPPDIIFGDKSVYNALKCIEDKDACFSAPTARVSLSKVAENKDLRGISDLNKNLTNAQLVNCLFECSHQDIEYAHDNLNPNTTFDTGISIRKLNSNTYTVIHNIPSVFLGKFKAIDLLFFHIFNNFNEWDRKWQSILIRNNRLKISGSSDLFFILELTKDSDKIARKREGMINNDLKNEGLKLEHLIPNQIINLWTK